jgi:hypothetical protein
VRVQLMLLVFLLYVYACALRSIDDLAMYVLAGERARVSVSALRGRQTQCLSLCMCVCLHVCVSC